MRQEANGKSADDIQRILDAEKKAQDALAGHRYNGVFQKWLIYIGVPKTSAYEYISMYETAVRLSDVGKLAIFEALPSKLARKISAKSSESTPAKSQAKVEVLNGDIDTLKAYRERIAELEAQAKRATEKAEQAESARQIAEEIFFQRVVPN